MKNYWSFYDWHVLCPGEGMNYILGSPGYRRSLCDALEFAFFGSMRREDKHSIINGRRVEEAVCECDWVGCRVRFVFMIDGGRVYLDRELSFIGRDYARDQLGYSTALPEISRETYSECIYLEEPGLGEVKRAVERNREQGLGFMLIDGTRVDLQSPEGEELLEFLRESGLQVLFLAKPSTSDPEGPIRLGENLEYAVFKARGFPFDPEMLEDQVDSALFNRYLTEGTVFNWDLYGHEYSVEAVDVHPDGARYQRDTSELKVT